MKHQPQRRLRNLKFTPRQLHRQSPKRSPNHLHGLVRPPADYFGVEFSDFLAVDFLIVVVFFDGEGLGIEDRDEFGEVFFLVEVVAFVVLRRANLTS